MSTKDTRLKEATSRLVEGGEDAGMIDVQPQEKRSIPVVLRMLAEEGAQKTTAENMSLPPAVALHSTPLSSCLTRRLFAWMTDSVIISLLASIAVFITTTAFRMAHEHRALTYADLSPERIVSSLLFLWIVSGIYNFAPVLSIYLILNIMLKSHSSYESFALAGFAFVAASLVQQAYYVLFTTGSLQATPGKVIFGLKVESESGVKASRLSVLAREVTKAVSTGFLGIPLLITQIFPGRRFLHESLSWTKVISVESKATTKVGKALAAIAASVSTLIIGFIVFQLVAPVAYEFSISPKLAICKRVFGVKSVAYRERLWDHIDTLFYRYRDPLNTAENIHLLTPHELAVFDEEIEQLSKDGAPGDPRFIVAYREAIRHFDFKEAGDTKERYLRRFISLEEGTKDPSFLQTLFYCSDGYERNAYGALADHLLCMGTNSMSETEAKDYFRQAWIAAVRGTVKLENAPPSALIDAALLKARAAQHFDNKLILASALKELLPLEISLYESDKSTTYLRQIRGVGSSYDLFNDMLTLAEIQVNRNEFAELDKTLATMTSTFEKYKQADTWVADRFKRVSPDEATQLEHYARLYPKYAKTLNYMAGNR